MSKRILLIDDEIDIHSLVEIGLTMEAQWEVLTALSGDEGIQLAIREQPDVILLDVMMPGRDGISTLRLLLKTMETKDIPVIFLTAKARAMSQEKINSIGAKGIIPKPFDPTNLAHEISCILTC